MYWLLDKINDRYKLVTKENYNYRCTFMWGVLSCLIFYSFVVILIVLFPLVILGLTIAPWFPDAFDFVMANTDAERMKTQSLMMLGTLLFALMMCNKKLREITTDVIDYFMKSIANFSKAINRLPIILLDTFCKKIK